MASHLKLRVQDRAETQIPDRAAPDPVGDQIPPKDETEKRLEKILFGDDAGFLQELEAQRAEGQLAVRPTSAEVDSQIRNDEKDVEDLADENLFFLDSGAAPPPHELDVQTEAKEGKEGVGRSPAWVDSDDDRLFVSLASNSRLRKLRNAETEDVVNGREYIERLRRQYERLHPTPAWAKGEASVQTHTRRRRLSNGSNGSSSADGADRSDISDDDIPVQPPTQSLAVLLGNAGSLTRPTDSTQQPLRQLKLRPEVVDIQRTKEVTAKGPSSIDSLQFHPDYPLLLASGPSSTVSIYQIAPDRPKPNPLLTSLHVKKTPLHSTAFLAARPATNEADSVNSGSTTVYLSSRRRYIHTWSLDTGHISRISRPFTSSPQLCTTQRSTEAFRLSPCDRYIGFIGSARKGGGHINVFSTTTGMQWLCSCRVDSRGGVADFAWWADGNGFVVAGKNGECSEYDIQERRVVTRWIDDGAVGTTVIALGGSRSKHNDNKNPSSASRSLGGDRWIATGSSSGIVNIYDRREWIKNPTTTPKPTRTLPHLTTPTSHLIISPDGQLLIMASRWKKDALRLVHLPSCTVYRNWPTQKTPLGRVSSVALSCGSPALAAGGAAGGAAGTGMLLAVGNEQGAIRLWEIRG